MSPLDHWQHFAEPSHRIICSSMELLAQDGEPSLVKGKGEIRVASATRFEYFLTGEPKDVGYALKCLKRQRDNPYDALLRFRLVATDEAGNHLALGWTIPETRIPDDGPWQFSGGTESLWADDTGDPRFPTGGTEVRFLIPRDHPGSTIIQRFVSTSAGAHGQLSEHTVTVLATPITFAYDDATGVLTVSAPASPSIPATLAENWFGEPLRIMFGQLIYPRLVARTLSLERAMICIRPSLRWRRESDWAALWSGPKALIDRDGFWRLYAALLEYVANARDAKGNPNFEPNKLTGLYEEVIQAAHGSRWVWALTFASSIEALIRMLVPRGARREAANHTGIASINKHIDNWEGADKHLKRVAKAAVLRTAEVTPIQALRDLRDRGVVTKRQVDAWDKIRNHVMHGCLVSPYSSEADDRLLLNLAGLMHALARQIVDPRLPSPANPATL